MLRPCIHVKANQEAGLAYITTDNINDTMAEEQLPTSMAVKLTVIKDNRKSAIF